MLKDKRANLRYECYFVPSTKVCCHFWGKSAKSFLVQHAVVKKEKKEKKKIFESKATVFITPVTIQSRQMQKQNFSKNCIFKLLIKMQIEIQQFLEKKYFQRGKFNQSKLKEISIIKSSQNNFKYKISFIQENRLLLSEKSSYR